MEVAWLCLELKAMPNSRTQGPSFGRVVSRVSYDIYHSTMNSILQRFSGSNAGSLLSKSAFEEDSDCSDAMWGSEAGFGSLAKGVPGFVIPSVPNVSTTSVLQYN